jgi:SAM-dependent methyltransferase
VALADRHTVPPPYACQPSGPAARPLNGDLDSLIQLLKSSPALPEAVRLAYTIAFYDQHTGITEELIGCRLSTEGKTSYQTLFEVVEPARGKTILDLACGSGPAAQPCLAQIGERGRLLAIDINLRQLQLASDRFAARNALFLCAPAQRLPVRSESVDAVLCHLACMAMVPLEPIVGEIGRVLKPGGLFAAVFGGIEHPAALYDQFDSIFWEELHREAPQFRGFGDPRTKTLDGLRSLFPERLGFAQPLEKHDFCLVFRERPAALTEAICRFYNAYHLLSAAGRHSLRERAQHLFASQSDNGDPVTLLAPQTRITLRKIGA